MFNITPKFHESQGIIMEYFQTSIKIPTELYEKIKNESSEEERTVTGEIIYILKQYFKNK